jgi:hypothetical protein
MAPDGELEQIAGRLESVANQLDDLITDRIRSALQEAAQGDEPDPALLAEEKRLSRARRSVAKAVAILQPPERDPT